MDRVKNNSVKGVRPNYVKNPNVINKDPECLIPVNSNTYIKNLPSSFNELMDHLSEEKDRSDMRISAMEGLKKVLNVQNPGSINTNKIMNHSITTFKELLKSHFPSINQDDKYRRLITQRKKNDIILKKDIKNARNASELDKIVELNDMSEELKSKIWKDEGNKIYLRRKAAELREIINNAKKEGKKEAEKIIIQHHKKINSVKLNDLPIQNKFFHTSLGFNAKKNKSRNKEFNNCLTNRLYLKKNLMNTNKMLDSVSDSTILSHMNEYSLRGSYFSPKKPSKPISKIRQNNNANMVSGNLINSHRDYKVMKLETRNFSNWHSK